MAGCRLLDSRQINPERGSDADFAINVDVAAALLDDAVHHRQPQARSLADAFGGEEGLKDARLHFRRHAAAGIADGHHDEPPRSGLRVRLRVGLVEFDIAGFDA